MTARRFFWPVETMGAPPPLQHRPRPVPPTQAPVAVRNWLSTEDLVRIATDEDPTVGAAAPDQLLGPFADTADPAWLRVAVAWGALFPNDAGEVPFDRLLACKTLPYRPPRAVRQTPAAPWRVRAWEGDTVWVEDVVGLGPFVPDTAVRCDDAVLLGQPPSRLGLLARIVRTPQGWRALSPIVIPSLPSALPDWLWEEAQRSPHAKTWSDVLLSRGHHLVRRILTHTYLQGMA